MNDRPVRAAVAQLAKPPDICDGLVARAVGIGPAVLLGRRDHRGNLGDARRQRFIDAAFVEYQCDSVRARKRSDGPDDLAHVGELRERLGGQERANLEMPHAGGIFVADPALLRRRRREGLHQLQAVPQPYFAQDHSIVGIDVGNAGHASLTVALAVAATSRGEVPVARARRESLRCRRRAPALSGPRRCSPRSTRPAAPVRGTARRRH